MKRSPPKTELKELEDYYTLPDGRLVFTEQYHLKRGYCCKSGCLHCPYDGITVEDNKSTSKSSSMQFHTLQCPYCFENFEISILAEDGENQFFVYDCEICCRPIEVTIDFSDEKSNSPKITLKYANT